MACSRPISTCRQRYSSRENLKYKIMPSKTHIDLSGRAAIVTGGARGIGYACAERLLRSGAAVTLWDHDGAALDAAAAALAALGQVRVAAVDVTDEHSVAEAGRKAGSVDILVNNAGITGPNKTTWAYTP